MNTTTTAENLAQTIADGDLDPFHMAAAHLYGIDSTGNVSELDQHPDVYELISRNVDEIPEQITAVLVVTTGWAAPIADGIAPSEHAERVRVRLSVYVPRDASPVSVVMFANGRENVIDENDARGTLADAIQQLWW